MKIYIPLNEGDNLGGSLWVIHVAEALRAVGHEIEYCTLETDTSEGDFTLIQSEWIEKTAYTTSKRAIVLLGHFTSEFYPDSTKLRERDVVLTQWMGEVVSDWEARSKLKAHYFPHAYSPQSTYKELEPIREAVWIGSHSPFRDTSWLNGVNVEKMTCEPGEVDFLYQSSAICPNIHLSIQKGTVLPLPEAINNKPGHLVNERTFWITGAGGFEICDNPLVRDFYDEDEVALVQSEEEFKDKFSYYLSHEEERRNMARKARERTFREHTYLHRIRDIVLPLL